MSGRAIPVQDPILVKMNLTENRTKSQVIHHSYLIVEFHDFKITIVTESTTNSPSYPHNPLNESGSYPSGSYPGTYSGYGGLWHPPGRLNSSGSNPNKKKRNRNSSKRRAHRVPGNSPLRSSIKLKRSSYIFLCPLVQILRPIHPAPLWLIL